MLKYRDRDESMSHMNFNDFYQHQKQIQKQKKKESGKSQDDKMFILQVTGLGSYPVWPVNDTNGHHYARSTLIMYKPWSSNKPLDFENCAMNKSVAREYHELLRDKDCPNIVKLHNANAMRHYFLTVDNNKYLDCHEDNVDETEDNNPSFQEMDDLLSEVFNCSKILQRNNFEYKELNRGLNYVWWQRINPQLDPDNDGCNWLNNIINAQNAHETVETLADGTSMKFVKNLPMKSKSNQIPFQIQDIDNNDCQADIVYTVIKAMKDWIEFPKKILNGGDVTFQPLRMTVKILQRNNFEYKELNRGLNYVWWQRINPQLDPDNDGCNWLNNTINAQNAHETVETLADGSSMKFVKNLPMKSKSNQIPFQIQDIDNNDCQADITLTGNEGLDRVSKKDP